MSHRHLRFVLLASGIALFLAAGTGMLVLSAAGFHFRGKNALTVTKGDPDAVSDNEDLGPEATAEGREAALRAYPLTPDELPIDVTLNAQRAFASIKARASSGGGAWQLIGPSKATYPGVLNFLGDHDQYVASGRVTALAIGPTCTPNDCILYLGAAGGGLWRTTKALSGDNANWQFISSSFATNAIGTITVDANDPTGRTVYAGTGEPNASGDSEAGMGIYKSTNGGDAWTLLPGSITPPSNFQGRSISSIVIAPNGDILAGIARGIRGYSGNTGGATSNPPPSTAPAAFGVYRSSNGGASFTLIWDVTLISVRGVNHVAIDPITPTTIYAAAFNAGVWRSTNNGVTFTQIKSALNPSLNTDRAEFAVNALANGKTRMYVGVGNSSNAGANRARFYRTDDAAGAAVFTDMTTPQNIGYCTAQCWYDNAVVSPAGHPDVVYLAGSFDYDSNGAASNGRAVLLSTDGGATFTDSTQDGDPNHAEAIHPDQHALVLNPNDPLQMFEGSDGGIVRTDGGFADVSYKCDSRGLNPADTALCKSLLSRVPDQIVHLNNGLSTLQFNSISVSSQRPKNNAQAGTQDNGTFQYTGSPTVWWQEIYGDGGQSGFNAADDSLRFNTFFGQASDVNFHNGDATKWVVATGPIVSSPEGSNFYPPIIADPNPTRAGTIFQGSQSVWRTQDWGGDQAYLEANCPEFTTSAANPACGDFVRIGVPGTTDLTAASYGTRAGGFVSRIARAPSNTGTIWASTNTGRLFISDNGDAPAAAVVWERLDTSSLSDPGRFISGIFVDPANPNRAFVSYSGYNFNTPAQPGHVFEVLRTGPGTATWTNLDGGTGPLGDLPTTDVVYDAPTNTLYAATDFAVLKKALPAGAWVVAGTGMPQVEVAGLTIVSSERILYAATHGRSMWMLKLP